MSSKDPSPSASTIFASSPTGTGKAGRGQGSTSGTPDETIEVVSSEVDAITAQVGALLARLDTANNKLTEATSVRMTEWEIGRLFVEAQEFTDSALNTLDEQTHQMLADAEREADDIVANARLEAERIVAEAKARPALPAETVTYLQETIAGFARVNEELIKELGFLNELLEARAEGALAPQPDETSALPNWDPIMHRP